MSLTRQCKLLGLARSRYYAPPQGESQTNLRLMRLIDEQYTKTPFYGSPKMTLWLREQGEAVNHKRVERLMRLMGLQASVPKRSLTTSQPTPPHKVYPYLLKDVPIERVNQVWSSDITYLRLRGGFVYLTAVIDWFSRYVLSWQLSLSLEADFCVQALDQALEVARPLIFNTDQGAQFTSEAFTSRLEQAGIQISQDGTGRALDNIFVERLWRTVKYEEVYLNEYANPRQAEQCLGAYFRFYNQARYHQALNYQTPAAVFSGSARHQTVA